MTDNTNPLAVIAFAGLITLASVVSLLLYAPR